MAFIRYLKFGYENIPTPDSYDISLSNVVADSSGETEAGTMQRDLVRTGVVNISVSFSVSAQWVQKLSNYSKLGKIEVSYFDTTELVVKNTEMYIEGFKANLEKDTSYKGLWKVSFELKEF